jgi:hypothetical protein
VTSIISSNGIIVNKKRQRQLLIIVVNSFSIPSKYSGREQVMNGSETNDCSWQFVPPCYQESLECVSKVSDVQVRVDFSSKQGGKPQACWRQVKV